MPTSPPPVESSITGSVEGPGTKTSSRSLRFQSLVRSFGRLPVLRGVSGEVAGGGTLLITGSNGSGKSTLLQCLAGLLAPDRGSIHWIEEGRELSAEERRQSIGFAAPVLSFYEPLTTLENLELFSGLRGVPPQRGQELLERVGLPLSRPAGALSSGMAQRLRWCFALLHSPTLLLLDEPFQNLDAPGRRVGAELLQEHLDQGGMAVIASPELDELRGISHHIRERIHLDP
ncbi:MAG: ATP-binding cassette domain-containing protein [Acidobacteriota bacterium]